MTEGMERLGNNRDQQWIVCCRCVWPSKSLITGRLRGRALEVQAPVATRLFADLERHFGARLPRRTTRRMPAHSTSLFSRCARNERISSRAAIVG